MTITAFNKPSLQIVRTEVQAALDEIAARHGITLKMLNISYTPDGGSFTTKVEGKVEAIADAKAEAEFKQWAGIYGLDTDKVATTPQGAVRLVGYNSKKRAKPWLIEVNGKKGYVADQRYVEFYFKKAA